MKKTVHYLLAFLIPISIFLFAMYLMDLYPFGDTSFRVTDAISQYPAFFEGLKDGDLFTFKIGMGANFYTIFTTYLASPLSFLYLFFENYQFDLFFLILVLLKIGLIGLNMNILLNYKNKISKYSLMFSTIYALSGYVALYYFNYQFLDALYMLPLIMIGIEKIVCDNKNLMYFITLTLMIIFHYYTAFMICIFSVIYFFFLLVNSDLIKKEKKRRIIKFFVTSLFCGLCSSFITIPSIYGLLQGRGDYFGNLDYFGFNENVLSFFYNLTSGSNTFNDLVNTSAPIFITLFILVLIIYSFFNKNFTRKYKIFVACIILFYLFCLSCNLFYYGWHLFQRPVGLPGRFVFTFDCFFVLIAFKTFSNCEKITIKYKSALILFIILFAMAFVCKFCLIEKTAIDRRYYILAIFNLLIFIYYLFFIRNRNLYSLTFFLVFLELLINIICSFNLNFAYIEYNNVSVKENRKRIIEINNFIKSLNNNDFIRMEVINNYNGGMLYGYHGVSRSSSIFNNNLNSFLKYNKLNTSSYNHYFVYEPNFLMNSLIGVQYELNYYNTNKTLEIMKNKYIIESLGFMVNDNLIANQFNINLKQITPKLTLKNVTVDEDVFILNNKTEDGIIIYEYLIEKDSIGYIDLNLAYEYFNYGRTYVVNSYDLINLYLNNKLVSSIYELKKGDKIRLELKIPRELGSMFIDDYNLKYVEKDSYLLFVNDLNNNKITNLKFNRNGFTGNLQVSEVKDILLLTIPYDDNINIYINGKQHEYSKYLDGIIGMKLTEGEYIVEFQYRIKGLDWGIIISCSSLLLFGILKILEKKSIYRYNKNDNKEEF